MPLLSSPRESQSGVTVNSLTLTLPLSKINNHNHVSQWEDAWIADGRSIPTLRREGNIPTFSFPRRTANDVQNLVS